MTPEQRVIKAMRDAQVVLSAYFEPGFHNPEETVSELLRVLDDDDVVTSLIKMEAKHIDCPDRCIGDGSTPSSRPATRAVG